ncbi:MAG: MBL fold metallo-hydrolase [Promethearchaeota archaeon]
MLDFIKSLPNELADFLLIKSEEVSGYYTSNSLLVGNTLIDTGCSINYLKQITKNYKINQVIFTHWHEDHISGSALLKKNIFLCHSNDKEVIENIDQMPILYGYKEAPSKNIIKYLEKYDLNNTKIDKTIKDNEIINIGSYKFKVLHIPGHASGLCGFYEESLKFAHLSDISMPDSGPWYGGLDSSLVDYEESLEKILQLKIRTAFMSHYGFIENGKQILDIIKKQKEHIEQRDQIILSYFSERKPINSNDLWKKGLIFKGESIYEQPLINTEKIMIEKHFEKFLKKEMIEPYKDGYIFS